MVQEPTSLGEVMHALKCYLEVGTSATSGATSAEFVQLEDWNFPADHSEEVSAYGTGEQYDHGHGGMLFTFVLRSSTGAYDYLANRFRIGTAAGSFLTTYHWRLKYYTKDSAAGRYINFEGRLRNLHPSRTAGGVTLRGTVRLCDDDGVWDGQFPVSSTSRA